MKSMVCACQEFIKQFIFVRCFDYEYVRIFTFNKSVAQSSEFRDRISFFDIPCSEMYTDNLSVGLFENMVETLLASLYLFICQSESIRNIIRIGAYVPDNIEITIHLMFRHRIDGGNECIERIALTIIECRQCRTQYQRRA